MIGKLVKIGCRKYNRYKGRPVWLVLVSEINATHISGRFCTLQPVGNTVPTPDSRVSINSGAFTFDNMIDTLTVLPERDQKRLMKHFQ